MANAPRGITLYINSVSPAASALAQPIVMPSADEIVDLKEQAKILCLYNHSMETTCGRPPKPEKERREIRFQLRLSPAELQQLERAADGKTSPWARKVLL